MALDTFPGTLGGDTHFLVVVTNRAARSERIAQPVAVFDRDCVGVIGECGCSLVGRDNEVRVICIVPNHALRRYHQALDEVVCQIKQAAQEVLITGDAFFQIGLSVACRRRHFQHEPAFRTNRHDDSVLHHLRFDESEHFGAEIFRAIRPAQTAARHFAAAQMNTFKSR